MKERRRWGGVRLCIARKIDVSLDYMLFHQKASPEKYVVVSLENNLCLSARTIRVEPCCLGLSSIGDDVGVSVVA